MSEYKETKLKGSLDPMTIESHETILNQMKNNVCKISSGEKKGTGFFLKIPYKNELLSVFVTNNHVLGEEDIEEGKIISFSLNNGKILKYIKLDSKRKKYTNEILDVTIIEIKEDKDKIKDFLTLDEKIIEIYKNKENINYYKSEYENESIYILNYMDGEKIYSSYGLLNSIDDYKISHKCNTDNGSSGSPILSLKNNKVIGVHYGFTQHNFKINLGTFLLKPIREFQQITNSNIIIINKNNEVRNYYNKGISQINIKKNNIYESQYLKHLIRFPFFKKELISNNNFVDNNINIGYLLKSDIITKLKQFYSLKQIFDIFVEKNLFKGINYYNCDNNYSNISKYLNENQINYINIIKSNEINGKIKFSKSESDLNIKYINNLEYIDEFEIIDKGFADLLKEKMNKDINLFAIYYTRFENKILLIINLNQKYIFEIVSINHDGGAIIVEYLIETINNNKSYDINLAINSISKTLKNYGLQKLITFNSPISIENNFVINFHKLNCNAENNLKNSNFQKSDYKSINNINNKQLNISSISKNNNNYSIETKINNEYIPPIQLNITNSLQDFSTKPLVGLENIDSIPFLNSILQCFCNIQKLIDFFKYSKQVIDIIKNDTKKEKLCSAFKLLIENLYPYQLSKNYEYYLSNTNNNLSNSFSKNNLIKSYNPKNFKDSLLRMDSSFNNIQAIYDNNEKYLILFIIETLHNELNKVLPEKNDNSRNKLLDRRNKQLMFNDFCNDFRKRYKSISSDLFYAADCYINQCEKCKTIFYSYQYYNYLIFPLELVMEYKIKNNIGFSNNQKNNIIDIYDCLNYHIKTELMDGDNAMYCDYCKITCNSLFISLLTTGPEILIIILDRRKDKFNIKLNFYQELNLYNYIELKQTGYNYDLIGVVMKSNEIHNSAHFIAFCKSYWDNKWFKYNDTIISPVNDFKKEVLDEQMPSVLFYKKVNI